MTMTDTNGHTPPPVVDPPSRAVAMGKLELPQDTIDEIRALQRMRRDKTPNAVVAEGVEMLRRSIFDRKGRGK